jgi:hypothetical protein
MNLAEFNNLELDKKSDLVWEWGYFVTARKSGKYNIALFLIGDFFAEVHISITENKTEMINGVSNSELHKDFLEAVVKDDPFIKAVSYFSKAPFTRAA